jgi:hypothetical protein
VLSAIDSGKFALTYVAHEWFISVGGNHLLVFEPVVMLRLRLPDDLVGLRCVFNPLVHACRRLDVVALSLSQLLFVGAWVFFYQFDFATVNTVSVE